MQPYPKGEVAVVLDCLDLDRAADFWTEVLGYRRIGEPYGSYFSLLPSSGSGPELLLQKVADHKAGKTDCTSIFEHAIWRPRWSGSGAPGPCD